ncbi:MAG: NUDIX domain-containing protein [Patescibacteria group bacterium]
MAYVPQKSTARSVVKKNGLFVLVQETKGHKAGLMNNPGGRLDWLPKQDRLETYDEGGRRETEEESGLVVAHMGLISVSYSEERDHVKVTLAAEHVEGELTTDSKKHPNVDVYSLEDMRRMHHARELVKGAYEAALIYEQGKLMPIEMTDYMVAAAIARPISLQSEQMLQAA